jgi:hypothetical protein
MQNLERRDQLSMSFQPINCGSKGILRQIHRLLVEKDIICLGQINPFQGINLTNNFWRNGISPTNGLPFEQDYQQLVQQDVIQTLWQPL